MLIRPHLRAKNNWLYNSGGPIKRGYFNKLGALLLEFGKNEVTVMVAGEVIKAWQ